jgi:Ca2+-binding RTX toxin-like protein
VEVDVTGEYEWSSMVTRIAVSGRVDETRFTMDDGTQLSVSWPSSNKIEGGNRADRLSGTTGSDHLQGYSGDDVLFGGEGIDFLEWGRGHDRYYLGSAMCPVWESLDQGRDTVYASISIAVLPANVENLVLLGPALRGGGNDLSNGLYGNELGNELSGWLGDDLIYGQSGSDSLFGGAGDDVLDGGLGADVLHGGAGRDTLVWRAVAETGRTTRSADLILDFSHSQGDRLAFNAIDANELVAGNQAFRFIGTSAFSGPAQVRYWYAAKADETLVILNTDGDLHADGFIRLDGSHQPSADWFVL